MAMTIGMGRRETQVVGLISFAHFLSHLYMLVLPPLFPVIRSDLGLDYAALGVATAVFAIFTGALQTPMGFVCERIGSRPVLICGLFLNGAAIALVSVIDSYWQLIALMALAGVGSSVFHPADYSILSGTVSEKRLGRAFSIHTFGGSIGFAVAPFVMVGLYELTNWRAAVAIIGGVGVALSIVLLACSGVIGEGGAPKKRGAGALTWRDMLTSPTVMLFFTFYAASSAANAGISQFAVSALIDIYGISLTTANLALTIYMIASLIAVLPGGLLADYTKHHNLTLIASFTVSAAMVAAVGLSGLPFWIALVLLASVGALRGLVNTSRDIMVRHAVPGASVGTVFAFVTTGFMFGQAVSPTIYGLLMDGASPGMVFWASAGFSLICIATAIPAGWVRPAAGKAV
jgi:FSR family fosmidomycin resistance protein-like MFS transporter